MGRHSSPKDFYKYEITYHIYKDIDKKNTTLYSTGNVFVGGSPDVLLGLGARGLW